MALEIVRFRRKDQEEAGRFCDKIFSETMTDTSKYRGLDDFHAYFAGSREIFLLMKKDGEIIGCGGLLELTPDEAVLKRFYFAREHRGTGMAQILLEKLIGFAGEKGYRFIILDTHKRNIRAQKFFKKSGFISFKPRPTRKWDDTKDPGMFAFMRLKLG